MMKAVVIFFKKVRIFCTPVEMRYKFEDVTQKRNSQSIDFNVLFCVEDALKRGELDLATDK